MTTTRDSDIVLETRDISKKFSYSLRKSKRYIVSRLLRGAFGIPADSSELRPSEFWAVKDVSFNLRRGETLGLIGPNGAGKSTILKMISGLFLPDSGTIEVTGKVGALIELGAGFHPLLSGKENIYIKGAILGKKKREVDELFDEIVEFADLGKFIDSPVNTYSSGMYVRLGFAVAVYNNPDVLLVDEILAVGDFAFKQKCFSKVNEMKDKMSIVFISHNMTDIIRFCDRAAVLDEGELKFNGKTQDAVRYYLDEVEGREKRLKTTRVQERLSLRSFYGDLFRNTVKIADISHRWVTPNGKSVELVKHNQTIILEFSFRLLYKPKNLLIGVPIWDEHGNFITSINSDANEVKIPIRPDGFVRGQIVVDRLVFNPGVYTSVLTVVDGKETIYRQILNPFSVGEMAHSFGFITVNADWRF